MHTHILSIEITWGLLGRYGQHLKSAWNQICISKDIKKSNYVLASYSGIEDKL